MPLKMRLRTNEPIAQAVKRFKKLLERSGFPRDMRRHEYYEKPSEQRRRAKLRRLLHARRAQEAGNAR